MVAVALYLMVAAAPLLLLFGQSYSSKSRLLPFPEVFPAGFSADLTILTFYVAIAAWAALQYRHLKAWTSRVLFGSLTVVALLLAGEAMLVWIEPHWRGTLHPITTSLGYVSGVLFILALIHRTRLKHLGASSVAQRGDS
jgi:hypothetical protein